MICITGAGGTVGSEVYRQLEPLGIPFRLAYHSQTKTDDAHSKGLDAKTIDFNETNSLIEAFNGCNKLFLLGPNNLNQSQMELNAVEAAKVAGIQHIVKQSVMGAEEESFSLACLHRPVEKAIESSGIPWTFLRPNSFMQNVLTFMRETIKAENAFYSAAGDGKISHVDVRDIATVAVKALTDQDHEGKAYTLTGPDALSYDQLASELTNVLGRSISHINLLPVDLKEAMLIEGMPDELAERMLDLERYFREGHARYITSDIKLVTDRNPRQLAQFLRETAAVMA